MTRLTYGRHLSCFTNQFGLVLGVFLIGSMMAEAGAGRWTLCTPAVPTYIQSLAVAPNGDVYIGFNSVQHPMPSDLLVSHDQGISWVSLPHPGMDTYASVIAVAGTTPPTIFVGNASSVIDRSRDGGQTWGQIDPSRDDDHNLSAIAVDPANAERVYAAFKGLGVESGNTFYTLQAGLFTSTDGGDTWAELSPEIFELGTTGLVIDPNDSAKLYASTVVGIYVSNDFGTSWHQLSDLTCPYPTQWAPGPSDFSLIFSVGSDNSIYGYSQYTLEQSGCHLTQVSHDGGDMWSVLTPPRNDTIFGITVNPVDPSMLLANCGFGALASRDGGHTWREFSGGHPFSLLSFSPDGRTIYGVTDTQIYTLSLEGITPVSSPSVTKVRR